MKTIFNPKNQASLTYADILEPAMEITKQVDADQYKEAYIQWLVSSFGCTAKEAETIVNSNLGYYAGYYSDDIRKRVEKLFRCSHPIFGSIEQNGRPTGEEAFICGKSGKTLKEVRTP